MLERADTRVNAKLGIQVDSVEPGSVTLAMTVLDDMTNSQHFCHGGMIFSLADAACAYAIATENVAPATLDATISFIRPAREGQRLYATARVIQSGRQVARCDVEVTDEAGRVISVYRGSCINRGQVVEPATPP